MIEELRNYTLTLIRIRVSPMSHEVTFEIEGAEKDILDVTDETIKNLIRFGEKFTQLSGTGALNVAPSKIESEGHTTTAKAGIALSSEWFETQAGRPHLGSAARKVGLKDLALLTTFVHRSAPLSRVNMSSREIYQFLVEDGFPVTYKDVRARVSDATRDGTLIKMGEDGYRLSRNGEDRISQIISGT